MDIEVTIACKLSFNDRLNYVRNDITLSLHSPMVNLKKQSELIIKSTIIKLHVPVSELVSYHVKQKLRGVLSVFDATPVSVPITDS